MSRCRFAVSVAALMRVGVIGVGSMGQNHVRVYSEIADVVGSAGSDVKAGGVVWNRFNVSYYTDSADLLKEELDAVSVCVPTEHHAKVALDVIRAGIPVLVEKPLAATVEEAKRIVDAAKTAGVTLAVGHIERHNPAIAAVKRHVQEGQYGDLVTAAARRVSSFPGRVRAIHVRKEEPLRRELEDFLHSIQEKRPPLVSGEDAVETLRVAIAATESHRTGKLVQLT